MFVCSTIFFIFYISRKISAYARITLSTHTFKTRSTALQLAQNSNSPFTLLRHLESIIIDIIETVFVYTTTHRSLKAYCAILVRRSNFRHQASPRVSPRESTQRRKVELWARNVPEFCLNTYFHVTFRYLLHAVKLRHGTYGFTSPPKEGVLRIFSP
jgi:hypothetical protein